MINSLLGEKRWESVRSYLWRKHWYVHFEASVRIWSSISRKVFIFIVFNTSNNTNKFFLNRLFTIHVSTWDYPGNLAKIIGLAARAELVVREIRHIRGKVSFLIIIKSLKLTGFRVTWTGMKLRYLLPFIPTLSTINNCSLICWLKRISSLKW